MGHKLEPKKDGEFEYSQCKLCGKVTFKDDPYFNMICSYPTKRIADLRSRLEAK